MFDVHCRNAPCDMMSLLMTPIDSKLAEAGVMQPPPAAPNSSYLHTK
jgi:hypothetical protein